MNKILLLISILSLNFIAINQTMQSNNFNLNSLRDRSPKISEELLENTPDFYKNHPEFGILPYNAPCADCFELLEKRTDSTRMFLKNGTNGTEFYSQAVLGLYHFDKNGYKLSYDPTLDMTAPGYFLAANQDKPSFLDLINKRSGFKAENEDFLFNNNIELILVNNDGSEISMGTANYSNYTIGDQGARIIDAWPNIDIQIIFQLDKIKSNYVIKGDFADLSNVKFIKFSDNLVLPSGYTISEFGEDYYDENNMRHGIYSVRDAQNIEHFNIEKASAYDQSGIKDRLISMAYEMEGTKLSVFVPQSWMTSTDKVYPLIIDPTVNSSATFTAGFMVFLFGGDWCGGVGNCAYNLIVPRPANSTITGTTFSAQYNTIYGGCFGCYQSEAAFKIASICGTSPAPVANHWSCNFPGTGTCTGTNINIFSEVGTCLGAACSGNVTFQIRNSYCYCNYGAGCPVSCQSMPNNTWSMTLVGRTLETLGNTASGNGTQNIVAATCSGNTTLNPAPANGVPGYTYLWNTGATTPTVNVPSSGGPYTCQVTDACGVSRTATFVIICPLAVTYEYFTVESVGRSAILKWKTIDEEDNDYFRVEYSSNGQNFQTLIIIDSKGESGAIYEYVDLVTSESQRYYRIVNVDLNGEEEFTEINLAVFDELGNELLIVPNPNNGDFSVNYDVPLDGNYILRLIDTYGKECFYETRELEKGKTHLDIETNSLRKGVYIFQLITENQVISKKIIVN